MNTVIIQYRKKKKDKTRIQYKNGDTWMIEDLPMPSKRTFSIRRRSTDQHVYVKLTKDTLTD